MRTFPVFINSMLPFLGEEGQDLGDIAELDVDIEFLAASTSS